MAAQGLRQHKPNALIESSGLRHPKEWGRHLALAWGTKCAVVGAPRPSKNPPCSPPKSPFVSLCSFSAVVGLLVGQTPFPRSLFPSSSSFASLGREVGRGGKSKIRRKLSFWDILGWSLLSLSHQVPKTSPWIQAIFISSSELVSTWVTMSLGDWAIENLSKSISEFQSSTGLFGTSPSSSRWNWSISALRDRCVEAVSSLGYFLRDTLR